MRNAITNPKKLRAYSHIVGRDVVVAMTRGNTNHRVDVRDCDGFGWSIFRDGTVRREAWMDDKDRHKYADDDPILLEQERARGFCRHIECESESVLAVLAALGIKPNGR